MKTQSILIVALSLIDTSVRNQLMIATTIATHRIPDVRTTPSFPQLKITEALRSSYTNSAQYTDTYSTAHPAIVRNRPS